MIKLIIFDLWQTLAYRDGDHHQRAVRKMLKETGVNIPLEKFIKIFENSVQTKRWKSKFEAYQNLCKNMGLEPTKDNVNLLIDIRDNAEARTKLYSHVIPMLRQLRKQGYKIGLMSNTSTFAIDIIKKKTSLLKYIDYPLCSYDVGVIKPSKKFFKKMLKISNCKPKEAVMIGDKPGDDVIPARKLGMDAIHFKNGRQLRRDLKRLKVL